MVLGASWDPPVVVVVVMVVVVVVVVVAVVVIMVVVVVVVVILDAHPIPHIPTASRVHRFFDESQHHFARQWQSRWKKRPDGKKAPVAVMMMKVAKSMAANSQHQHYERQPCIRTSVSDRQPVVDKDY